MRAVVKGALLVAAALLLASPAGAEWVEWIADAGLAFEWDDNVNRSAFDADEVSDFRWRPAVRGGRIYQLTDHTRLSFAAELEGALYHDWDGLNHFRAGGTAAVLHKFGTGPNVPTLRFHGTVGYLGISDHERSSVLYEAGIQLSKRFSPRFDAAIDVLYSDRDGRNGTVVVPTLGTDVWDQANVEVGAVGNFLITPQILASVGYRYRDGEFDSACTPGNVATVFAREGSNVEAIAIDDVFGGCVYRLDGHMHGALVNLSYGLSDHLSVDLGYRFQHGKARSLAYDTNIVTLSLLFRY